MVSRSAKSGVNVDLAALEQRARERRAKHANQSVVTAEVRTPEKDEGSTMTEATTSNSAWGPLAAGVAGLLLGENGIFGKNGNSGGGAVTPDQLGVALGNLQGTSQRERLSDQINLLGAGNAIGHASIKDAVTGAAAQNALALCGLGNTVTQGNAAIVSTVQAGFASSERLALQQALDAERVRATELRIQLSEAHNNAQHSTTQVLLQQVINAK